MKTPQNNSFVLNDAEKIELTNIIHSDSMPSGLLNVIKQSAKRQQMDYQKWDEDQAYNFFITSLNHSYDLAAVIADYFMHTQEFLHQSLLSAIQYYQADKLISNLSNILHLKKYEIHDAHLYRYATGYYPEHTDLFKLVMYKIIENNRVELNALIKFEPIISVDQLSAYVGYARPEGLLDEETEPGSFDLVNEVRSWYSEIIKIMSNEDAKEAYKDLMEF